MLSRPLPQLLLLALVLSACGSEPSVTLALDKPLRVSVVKVGQAELPPLIEAAGTAALRKEIPPGFTSSGRIARILVQEGDFVRRGRGPSWNASARSMHRSPA